MTRSPIVRELRRIDEVPGDEWDALLDADDLQATHRFVRACEHAGVEGAEFRHLMLRGGGSLQAVATLCRMDVRLDLLAPGVVRGVSRAVRRVWPRFLRVPVVFCGLPVSFGQSLLRIAPGADRSAVVEGVREAAERFARETGARVVCFKEFTDAEAEVLDPLRSAGYLRLPSLPSCRLTFPAGGWDGYVGRMRAGYRRQLLATLHAARGWGLTSSLVHQWRGECPRIAALYEQVMDRAPVQLERLNLAYFRALAGHFAGRSSAVLVQRGGRTVAAAVLLHGPTLTTWLLAGIDYRHAREAPVYPFLVTEVIRHAIEHGAAALEMGQTSYALKQRLGATTSRRHLFVRYRGPLGRPLFRLASGVLFPEFVPSPRRVFADGA